MADQLDHPYPDAHARHTFLACICWSDLLLHLNYQQCSLLGVIEHVHRRPVWDEGIKLLHIFPLGPFFWHCCGIMLGHTLSLQVQWGWLVFRRGCLEVAVSGYQPCWGERCAWIPLCHCQAVAFGVQGFGWYRLLWGIFWRACIVGADVVTICHVIVAVAAVEKVGLWIFLWNNCCIIQLMAFNIEGLCCTRDWALPLISDPVRVIEVGNRAGVVLSSAIDSWPLTSAMVAGLPVSYVEHLGGYGLFCTALSVLICLCIFTKNGRRWSSYQPTE